MATAAILKFLSLRIMCTHVRQNFWKVSSNFEHHSKPTMNINSQHHNLLWTKFRRNRRIFYLAAILYLGYHGNGRHFEFFQPPQKAITYYGGYSYKVDHNMALKPWISIPNIKIYLETKVRPNRRIFVFGGHFVPWLPWQPHKSCHTLRWIFLQSFMKFDERNPIFFLILPFLFPW